MQKTTLVRYALDLPEAMLEKVRELSYKRKMEKHPIRTQRAIFIELLGKGLLFANDELPTETMPNP